MAAGTAQAGPLLVGPRTYMDSFKARPGRKDNPFTDVLATAQCAGYDARGGVLENRR